MGIKETILAYINQLKTVQVTNGDGTTVPLYVAIWNDQIERKEKGDGYVYPTPAGFLEVQFSEGMTMGMGATSYEVTVRIMLEHQHYNTEDTLDQDLIIFDVKDKVHRAMNMFKAPNCSPLCASNPAMDYNHDNTYLCVLEYRTHFIDYTGSMFDQDGGVYIEDTLTNPTINLNVTYDNNTPCIPKHGIGILNYISSVRVTPGEDIYSVGIKLESHVYINNINPAAAPTYLINYGDGGATETITVGETKIHSYTKAAIIEISSDFGAIIQIELTADSVFGVTEYMPVITQNINVDLNCIHNGNYPLTNITNVEITDGIMVNYKISDEAVSVLFEELEPVFPLTATFTLTPPERWLWEYPLFTTYDTVANDNNMSITTYLSIIEL